CYCDGAGGSRMRKSRLPDLTRTALAQTCHDATVAPIRRVFLAIAAASVLAGAVGCLLGSAAPTSGPPPSGHALGAGAVVATIPAGRPPTLLAVSPDGSRVVAQSSGQLSIIRTDTNAIAATVPTSPNPTGVAVTPDGRRGLWNAAVSAQLGVVDLDA